MVTADPQRAAEGASRGGAVVLIVAPGPVAGTARPGRLAVLVGDPGDPAVWQAAAAMESELFGAGAAVDP